MIILIIILLLMLFDYNLENFHFDDNTRWQYYFSLLLFWLLGFTNLIIVLSILYNFYHDWNFIILIIFIIIWLLLYCNCGCLGHCFYNWMNYYCFVFRIMVVIMVVMIAIDILLFMIITIMIIIVFYWKLLFFYYQQYPFRRT